MSEPLPIVYRFCRTVAFTLTFLLMLLSVSQCSLAVLS